MIYIFRTCLLGWDLYDLHDLLFPAGDCHVLILGTGVSYWRRYHIVIGTRTTVVGDLFEIGVTHDIHSSPSLVVADLEVLVAGNQAPMHTLPNSTSTQPRGTEAEYKHQN